jgi:hypothetical protein
MRLYFKDRPVSNVSINNRCLLQEPAVAQLVEALRHKPEGRGLDSRWCQSFRPHYGLGVNSACNRNEYQVYFLGVRAAGAWG